MRSYLPAEADRVLIAANPRAGARSNRPRVEQLASLLTERGLHVEISSDLDQVSKLSSLWHSAGELRAVVGAGGDGTAAELVNRTEPGMPIALMPLGTENLLAKYIGLVPGPLAACQTIADGAILHLDAGLAGGRIFLLMASVGFDADVVWRLHSARQGHIRHWTYLKPILEAVRSYDYPELRIYCNEAGVDGSEDVSASGDTGHAFSARWMFAFNLPCYGGGLALAPQACGNDELLDLCAFREGSVWQGLRYLSAVVLGRHQALADCVTKRVRRLRIEADRPVAYQLDGDHGGFLPLELEVLPRRLSLLVPSAFQAGADPLLS